MPMLDFMGNIEDLPVGCVESHFFDSGSFSLWSKSESYGKKYKCDPREYYETVEFWEYIDNYANFVKKYIRVMDYYANVDAIPHPKLTYRNQKYLEDSHGLTPVPVFHYPCDVKHLQRYVNEGYDYIGIGGLVGSLNNPTTDAWLDRIFSYICDTPGRLPRVKIHGFGVTRHHILLKYPWYSIDSASWTKIGAFGGIYVPHKRRGRFSFLEAPYTIKISMDSPSKKLKGSHVFTLAQMEKDIVREWLERINIPMGKFDENGTVLQWGVTTRHVERKAANLLYFTELINHLPDWPWPYHSTKVKGFGLM